ncbi:hypothetical protein Tco_0783040, partial [Tanacetum coccineum]
LRDVAIYYHFAISTFPVKIVIKSSAFILEYLLQLPIRYLSNDGMEWHGLEDGLILVLDSDDSSSSNLLSCSTDDDNDDVRMVAVVGEGAVSPLKSAS